VPDTRFDRIYTKLVNLESSRLKDQLSNQELRGDIKKKLEETLFGIDYQMKELESYKKSYESLAKEMEV